MVRYVQKQIQMRSAITSRPRLRKTVIHMLCVLCQHDEAVEKETLCLPRLEMIGRLQLLAELINARSMSKLKAVAGRAEYGQKN